MIDKRDVEMLVLLSIVTCGIYGIFFWWGYIKDINKVCEGDGNKSPNYLVVLLLSIATLGIYNLYWNYKQGNRLQAIALKYELSLKKGGKAVIMWSLLGSAVTVISFLVVLLQEYGNLGIFFSSSWIPRVLNIGSLILYAIAWNILIKNLNAVGEVYNARVASINNEMY